MINSVKENFLAENYITEDDYHKAELEINAIQSSDYIKQELFLMKELK